MNRIIPKKRWGQNFLIDLNICNKIVESIDRSNINKILEIGPGTGAITNLLAEKIGEVTAIEIDWNLCKILDDKKIDNLIIINQDILKADLESFDHKTIVGNLPYYITTPIIFNFFKSSFFHLRNFIFCKVFFNF